MLKKIKFVILGILGAGFNLLSFYLFYRFLVTAEFSHLWQSAVMALLFLMILVLQVALLRRFSYVAPFTLVAGLLPLVVFIKYLYPVPSFLVISGIVLLVLFLLVAANQGSILLANSIRIRFFSLAYRILPKAFLGLLLCFSLIGYFYYIHLGNFSSEVAYRWFGKTLDGSLPVLQLWFPTVSFDMTLDEALMNMSETQLRRSKIELLKQGIDIDKLSISARRELIERTSVELEAYFERIRGGAFDREETLRDFFYGIVESKINVLPDAVRALIGGGVIILFFFALRAMGFIFYIPIVFLGFILYKLLLLTGFAYITLENRKQEIVLLS